MSTRVFLIEPRWRCVREFEIDDTPADVAAFVRAVLNCRAYAKSPPLAGDDHGGCDAIYFSADKLVKGRAPRFWFQLGVGCGPVAGRDGCGRRHPQCANSIG